MAYGTIRADLIEGTNSSINLAVAGQYSFAGTLLPDADNTRNLGSNTLRYSTIFAANGSFTDLAVGGNVTLGTTSANTLSFSSRVSSDILPNTDNARNLGSQSLRWANIYTGDLHLANERGDWTVIEEKDYLSLRNNKTGKTFRLLMEEVES